jgi:hypothetical protein
MTDGKFYTFTGVPVGEMDDATSDHKVLVNSTDTAAGFLFNKQAPTSQIGFAEDSQNPGKFLVLLDKNVPEDATTRGSQLRRTISPFSVQQIDAEYTNLNYTQYASKVIMHPFTISIGEIKGFSLFTKSALDFASIDRLQVAIASNTENKIAGAKVEFFAQWGYGDENDNIEIGSDGKTFLILDSSAHKSISDLSNNYHFLILLVHIDSSIDGGSSMGLLAKSSSGSPLVEVGKNMNYCGQEINQKTILRTDFINPNTFVVNSNYIIQTNLQSNFPYIEFYQMRGE